MLKFRQSLVALLVIGISCHQIYAHPSTDSNSVSQNGVRFPNSETGEKQGKAAEDLKDSDPAAAARFGFLTNSIYPGSYQSSTGQYHATSPLKLDLGGLLVGGAIGLGLIFLLPKIFSPYGGHSCYNARSVDDSNTAASDLMSRISKALDENNIDPSSCGPRVICSYVQQANAKVLEGTATNFEKVVGDISSKASAENIFGSSTYQRALDIGREGGDCATEFPNCPSDSQHVFGAIKSFVIKSIV